MRIVAETVTLRVPEATILGGFGGEPRVTTTVSTELEANLVMLGREEELPLCLISVDLTYANQLVRNLHRTHSSQVEVQFFASHTHYGPSCMPEFPGLGPYAQSLVDEHSAVLAAAIDSLLASLASNGEFAELMYLGSFEHTVARRRRHLWSPKGQTVVRFPPSRRLETTQGKIWQLQGPKLPVFLWTFGCHPSGHFEHSSASAEFVGEVRNAIRSETDPRSVVVFVQAPSGDLRQPFMSRNPIRTGLKRWLVGMVPKLLPAFVIPSEREWHTWCDQLSSKVTSLVRSTANTSASADMPQRSTSISLTTLGSRQVVEDTSAPELQTSLLRLGDVSFVVVNAEITTAVARHLTDRFPTYELATCANESLGYIASDEEVRLGGYEVDGWVTAFGLRGGQLGDTASLLEDQIRQLGSGLTESMDMR